MNAIYDNKNPNAPRSAQNQRKPDNTRVAPRHNLDKLPAAVLAAVVHIAFFALIIFGVSWQVKSPPPISAELWDALPPARSAPAPQPVPTPVPTPPVPTPPLPEPVVKKAEPAVDTPPVPSKADIELKAKREREELVKQQKIERDLADKKKREETKLVEDKKKTEDDKKRRELETKQKLADAKLRSEQDAAKAAAEAEANAALAAKIASNSKAVNDYGAKVRELIRNRANIPDTVMGRPRIVVRLRLLVNGVVFDAKVINPSGNPVYDEAFERAINGIQQWPLPDNPSILGGQRELILKFEHER